MMRNLTEEEIREADSIKWFHRIRLGGNYTSTHHGGDHTDPQDMTTRFGLPEDLSGKTVLDIGAWDGAFSFEAERRGAQVLAVDAHGPSGNWGANKGFEFARRVLGSNVSFCYSRINDIAASLHGNGFPSMYDITLFFGVLYHLVDPFTGLINLRKVTREFALIETAICTEHAEQPLMEFRPGHEGDPTNWWYPTIECVRQMLLQAGFRSVELISTVTTTRATFKALVR